MYLVVDDKGASTAETSNRGHSVLHVSTDQVNVIYLQGAMLLLHETHIHNGHNMPSMFLDLTNQVYYGPQSCIYAFRLLEKFIKLNLSVTI